MPAYFYILSGLLIIQLWGIVGFASQLAEFPPHKWSHGDTAQPQEYMIDSDKPKKHDVGKLPALGWNSWNMYKCNISEKKILTAAKYLKNRGLAELGYEYVNIDDCWSVKDGRDKVSKKLLPDKSRFPSGIDGLAKKIHAMGLKLGIYSSAGTHTCERYPASFGFEDLDASTFEEWGVDYLKYDNCNIPPGWNDRYTTCLDGTKFNGSCTPEENRHPAPADYDWHNSMSATRYQRMGDSLQNKTRPILYSLCQWGQANVKMWGSDYGHSWRMSGDIEAKWASIAKIANMNSFLMNHVKFWGRPDADMLEVGIGSLSLAENRAHFALWAMMKSPLLIGAPLDTISPKHLSILKNKYLVKFNQDPKTERPAYPYKWGFNKDWTYDNAHPAEYWSGPSDTLGGTLVLLLNTEKKPQSRIAKWSEIPELRDTNETHNSKNLAYHVINVWTNKDLGCIETELSVLVESHDAAVYLIKNRCS